MCGSLAMFSKSAAVSRDLPMPASPDRSTTWPSPLFALAQRRSSSSYSSSRPTRAVRPLACRASKRLSTELARSAAQTCTDSGMPLSSLAPRSWSSKILPRSLRVLSAITTMFGSASPLQTRREVGRLADDATLLRGRRSDQVADHNEAGRNADSGLQRNRRLEHAHCRGQLQPRPDRPLGIVLMRLRIAKIHQHTVAQVLCHEAVETAHDLGDAFVIGRNDLAQDLRIHASGERR